MRLPAVLAEPLEYLGAMNTPAAMPVSGATTGMAGLSDCFKSKSVYILQAFKLIIVPVLPAALLVPEQLFGIDDAVVNTVLIAAAAPTASATIMFAHKFGRDERRASNHFALSTVASIVIIPLIIDLLGNLRSTV